LIPSSHINSLPILLLYSSVNNKTITCLSPSFCSLTLSYTHISFTPFQVLSPILGSRSKIKVRSGQRRIYCIRSCSIPSPKLSIFMLSFYSVMQCNSNTEREGGKWKTRGRQEEDKR